MKIIVLGLGVICFAVACDSNKSLSLEDQFRQQLPVLITVPSTPYHYVLFGRDGTITNPQPPRTAWFTKGVWKIENNKLIAEYLVIKGNEDGAPCSNEQGPLYPNKETCYKKHKQTHVYLLSETDGTLFIGGVSGTKSPSGMLEYETEHDH